MFDIQLLCVCVCVSQEFLELKVLLEAGSLVSFLKTSYFIQMNLKLLINPLNAELNSICCLLALLGAHHFLHVSRPLAC